jgi:hypothetical protein
MHAIAQTDNADASSSTKSALCASANSRLVLHDLKSIVEPPICKTVSSGLLYSKGCR